MKRLSLLVVVVGCAIAAVAVTPASAASVARSCRASALRAQLGGGAISEATVANRPDTPCVTDAAGAPDANLVPLPVQAHAVYAITNLANGPFGIPGQTASAASGATNLNIGAVGAASAINANVVASLVTTTCDGNTPVYNTSGQVASLTLGGQPVPLDGLLKQLTDGINGALGTLVQIKLNQVTLTPSGDGFQYRRRAIEAQVLPTVGPTGLINVVSGEAQVNRSGGVCDVPNPPLQCPPGASFDAKSGVCIVLQVVPGTNNPGMPCAFPANQTEGGSCVIAVKVNSLGQPTGGSIVPISQVPGGIPKACRVRTYTFAIVGTPGSDHITGTNGSDLILGLGGRDVIDGGLGNDCIDDQGPGRGPEKLSGGPGNDTVIAGTGSALTLDGGPGNDLLIGGRGSSHLIGGPGNDVMKGGSGTNNMFDTQGNNRFIGGPRRNFVTAGAGRDVINVSRGHRDFVNSARFGKANRITCGRNDTVRLNDNELRFARAHHCRFIYVVRRLH